MAHGVRLERKSPKMTVNLTNIADGHTIRLVIKAQSVWRGHLVRKNFISKQLHELAIQFITQNPAMKDVPRAASGITPVYLPLTLPLVFKDLGEERAKQRFFYIWGVRGVCFKNGYKFLLIPKARPYLNFNLEEKLPVVDVTIREQIALYEENKKKFSAAVREFTGLLCQMIFPDILTYSHPYLDKNRIPLRRCDNLPLLITENTGKIALIDQGGLQLRNDKLSIDDAIEVAKTSIYLFPYHFDEAMEVIYSYHPKIVQQLSSLKEISQQTVTVFKNIYANHKEFIKLTKSDFKHRMLTIKISEEKKDLIDLVMRQLLERNVICYANLYFNRSGELCVRVHY